MARGNRRRPKSAGRQPLVEELEQGIEYFGMRFLDGFIDAIVQDYQERFAIQPEPYAVVSDDGAVIHKISS